MTRIIIMLTRVSERARRTVEPSTIAEVHSNPKEFETQDRPIINYCYNGIRATGPAVLPERRRLRKRHGFRISGIRRLCRSHQRRAVHLFAEQIFHDRACQSGSDLLAVRVMLACNGV